MYFSMFLFPWSPTISLSTGFYRYLGVHHIFHILFSIAFGVVVSTMHVCIPIPCVFVCQSFHADGCRSNQLLIVFKSHQLLNWTYLELNSCIVSILLNMCGIDACNIVVKQHYLYRYIIYAFQCLQLEHSFSTWICEWVTHQSIVMMFYLFILMMHSTTHTHTHNATRSYNSGDEFLSSRHFQCHIFSIVFII